MKVGIKAIEYFLPEEVLTNEQLELIYEDWTAEKIFEKTGINQRHVVKEGELASDLAFEAAKKLFDSKVISPCEVEFILLATQSPDYILPTTACVLQDRLGLPDTVGSLDFNLGCSAFIYGLALAKGLIATGVVKNVLLITAETYSKHINPLDKSTRTIFGDAAAATLICEGEDVHEIGDFDLGTDGSGADNLIIPAGGMKMPKTELTAIEEVDDSRCTRCQDNLYMNGAEVFNFTISRVPATVENILRKSYLTKENIDLFVFHQANKFMLDFLRKKLRIPAEKFYINIQDIGNTVSASIPIALKRAEAEMLINKNDKVMLVGFGVGLSWGSTILTW